MVGKDKALNKMIAHCARRETCQGDVQEKLLRMGLNDADAQEVIARLVEQKFIDDRRFALAFCRDKVRFNSWGRTKIRYHLQQKKVDPEIIREALDSLQQEAYEQTLEEMLAKKLRQISPVTDPFLAKAKLIRFAASRGFEADLIYAAVDRLLRAAEE